MSSELYTRALKKIQDGDEVVGILGLGYVGLPLAVAFTNVNVKVLGFEKSQEKVDLLARKQNYIADVKDEELVSGIDRGLLEVTSDFNRISECDAVLICVPTPLDKFKKPDMSYIQAACEDIGRSMKPGMFVALESTTYPTTTEDFMLPILEAESGLRAGDEFWLAYSPERVDPGNATYKTHNTPKVVGGLGPEAQELAMALYSKPIESLHPVSSPRIAEMVKILENTYRLINISLMNEMALLAGKMEIDIWEVIEAAKTKPYGFQAFYPGPGIGGHCIPLDPFYLEYIAKNYAFDLTMIHTAGHIDTLMPHRMTIKITSALNRHQKSINGSRILFLGVAYKPNIADDRESPALKIMDEVAKKGGVVSYHDPYVAQTTTPEGRHYVSSDFVGALYEYDCVVITTRHGSYDFERIRAEAKLVVDLQNAMPRRDTNVAKL